MRLFLTLAFGILFLLAAVVFLAATMLSPVATAYNFPENKLWKHRQNTGTIALDSVKDGYQGVEIDITMHKGVLTVAHDAGELANAQTLEKWLEQVSRGGQIPHIWLDLKTLNRDTSTATRRQLLALNERYRLDGRLLVESPHPWLMRRLCQKPLTCSVWAKGIANARGRILYRAAINYLSRSARVAMVSIDYRRPELAEAILPKGFPYALYTYPTAQDGEAAAAQNKAAVYLTD